MHGPYTLYTACYPSTFDPNQKHEASSQYGHPDFEPNLKAGGTWLSRLTVPEKIRETADKANVKRTTNGEVPNCTWIIEIVSQVIFSKTATVHFDLLIGRDEKSVDSGILALTEQSIAIPGQLQGHQQGKLGKHGHSTTQVKGVFSKAVELIIDDTESLWNKPNLSEEGEEKRNRNDLPRINLPAGHPSQIRPRSQAAASLERTLTKGSQTRKRRKIHLVVITHGLHSNIGADMLYIKESIDAAAKQARLESRRRKKKDNLDPPGQGKRADGSQRGNSGNPPAQERHSTAPLSGGQDDLDEDAALDSEEEDVIVRGFSGNSVRTEKGIQYLGKRLAKFVLAMTYPDQPFLPAKKSVKRTFTRALTGQQSQDVHAGLPAHPHSSVHTTWKKPTCMSYKITSISFIAHSLGGLIQTYAIAYIHKHSPQFFEEIKPINFVAMATPFLGLSNENPLYVKFALDFGLVGRTGRDLGLAWRPPAMVRSGWTAMIGGIGTEGQQALRQNDPSSKPLLRILPTGPAHHVLKMFRNRTVYSNVVNDGIVPLRTSCLLFLDWSGLDRVEKARRENGIVGTMAGWGWAELTGANSSSNRLLREMHDDEASSTTEKSSVNFGISNQTEDDAKVPQPLKISARDSDSNGEIVSPEEHQFLNHGAGHIQEGRFDATTAENSSSAQPTHPISGFLNFLKPSQPKPSQPKHQPKPRLQSSKSTKIYKRSQTLKPDPEDRDSTSSGSASGADDSFSPPHSEGVKRDLILDDSHNVVAPPKTSIFESAGDILNPPLPSKEFIVNPNSRPRTIFHDRVYHPEDIPPYITKKRSRLMRTVSGGSRSSASSRCNTEPSTTPEAAQQRNNSGMKIEEKIARTYHHELSWRKVLVRLEPDAHNNICVRRMFANAYGWPVIKHLVDTHFAYSFAAVTADEDEPNYERAKPLEEGIGRDGAEVATAPPELEIQRTDSELYEAKDGLHDIPTAENQAMRRSTHRPWMSRENSAMWDDTLFDITDDDDDDDEKTASEASSPRLQQRVMDVQIPTIHHSPTDAHSSHGALPSLARSSNKHSVNQHQEGNGPSTAKTVEQENTHAGAETEGEAEANPSENRIGAQKLVIRGGTTSVGLERSVQEQLSRLAHAGAGRGAGGGDGDGGDDAVEFDERQEEEGGGGGGGGSRSRGDSKRDASVD